MRAPPPPPSQPSELSRESEARATRQMRMLQELAEIGMQLARAVGRQVAERTQEDPGGADTDLAADLAADLALVFSRISRAVRQTIALEARLDRELLQAQKAENAAMAEQARAAERALARRRKHAVREAVQEALDAEACGPELEALLADLDERLEDADDDPDFAELAIGQLVARICRQLGVVPDPSLWEDEGGAVHAGSPEPFRSQAGAEDEAPATNIVALDGADTSPRRLEHPPP